MVSRFYVGQSSDAQDGVFLVIGYDVEKKYALAFCLPEDHVNDVTWGQMLQVDISGPMRMVEGIGIREASLIDIEDHMAKREDAAKWHDCVTAYMEENGWTEDVPTDDLEGVMNEMSDAFDRFPD